MCSNQKPLSDADFAAFIDYFHNLQQRLTQMIESFEPEKQFVIEIWDRPEGGGGETRVIEGGAFMEKGGANFSDVKGDKLPQVASSSRMGFEQFPFRASGVSVVFHPQNPYVPTAHMNVRVFRSDEGTWWVGGGFDLTPYYVFEEDCRLWHQYAKAACAAVSEDLYPKYKKWCDEYFYLKHRKETRGIGGIFFDDVKEFEPQVALKLLTQTGDAFLTGYRDIAQKRYQLNFGQREREFQLLRRGRYVEFNLLFDRGTHFGIQSNGRTESILMSLPSEVRWGYDWSPEASSKEAELLQYLTPRDWV